MKPFTYHLPTKVVFGYGVVETLAEAALELDIEKALLVSGKGAMRKTGTLDRCLKLLEDVDVILYEDVEADPSVATVDEMVDVGRDCTHIVALGGGSPIDAAKAASVVLGNGGSSIDYLMGKRPSKMGPPIIAIPTTSGTGSEVTEVSVLSERESKFKKSFRSHFMYPAIALDDPELTLTMPKQVTASSGLDALAHAIEAYVSIRSQPVTDHLCLEAVKLVLDNLELAYEDGQDRVARENMMYASLIAGFAITHAGTGLAHGLSYGLWKAAESVHGLACGTLIPHVIEFNLDHVGVKYDRLAKYCRLKSVHELVDRIRQLNEVVGAPPYLRGLGIEEKDIESMIESGLKGSSLNSPRPIDEKNIRAFLSEAL
jgi:alcohol dehydrogenase class IV